ncbi:putative permease [Synechococcus sp. WH 8109]|nr:putative permease [Synechococcus sp. WH 8109]
MDKLATAWAIFQGLLLEAVPFLLLGVAIAGLARWVVPPGAWIERLPKNPLLAPIIGALMGFALPACECGNVPVARRLLASGAPMGTAFGFLFAAPVLNPIVLASTWAAFPDQPWLLVARPLGAFLLAILLSLSLVQLPETQLLATALLEERRMSQPLSNLGLLQRSSGVIGGSPSSPRSLSSRRLKAWQVLDQSCREFLDLLALLVLGCVIAALVQTWLPRSWLLAVGGCADSIDPGLDAAGGGVIGLLQRGCLSCAGVCRSDHPRSPAGLPLAGARCGSQTRRPVHRADAAKGDPDHGDRCQSWRAANRSVDQPVAAVRGRSC